MTNPVAPTQLNTGLANTSVVTRSPDGAGGEMFLLTPPWNIFLRNQSQQIQDAPSRAASPVSVPSSAAAIGVTPILTSNPLSAGYYRLSGYVRVTSAAASSSSIAVTAYWVDGGVSCSLPLVAAVTGNTSASAGSGSLFVQIDGGTPISYSTAYASNPASEMTYDLALVLEQVGAAA